MKFTGALKNIKNLVMLYGLVCGVEYYYFLFHQFPAITADNGAVLTYSTPWLTAVKNLLFDAALQEIGLLGIALAAAVLTAFLYTILMTGEYLITKTRNRHKTNKP